jgi:predicted nuclease with TOPRIM domain
MKLKYLMEEFLSYGKTKRQAQKPITYSIYKNATLSDLKEIIKENKKIIEKDDLIEGVYTKYIRYLADLENKVIYFFGNFIIHDEARRYLKLEPKNTREGKLFVDGDKVEVEDYYEGRTKMPEWISKFFRSYE